MDSNDFFLLFVPVWTGPIGHFFFIQTGSLTLQLHHSKRKMLFHLLISRTPAELLQNVEVSVYFSVEFRPSRLF